MFLIFLGVAKTEANLPQYPILPNHYWLWKVFSI